MTIKKSTRLINKKKISLKEFKAWLQGIEEIQPTGWTPSAEQWKMIRRKLHSVDDNILVVDRPVHTVSSGPRVPARTLVEGPPIASTLINERAPGPISPGLQLKGGKIITPNIESSDGYQTSFE